MEKIVMCGCTRSGIEIAKRLFENKIKISCFVTLNPKQAKNANVSDYVSFSEIAKKFNVPIYYTKSYSLKENKDQEFFEKNNFDLLILGGWNRLIPNRILKSLAIGGIGVHGSSEFLPKGKGRSPINWSIIEGKKRFIFHIFLLKPDIDNGDILDWEMCEINSWDSCLTIYYKNELLTSKMLVKNIPKLFDGTIIPTPQKGKSTFYPKRTPDDGIINWNRNVFEIHNFIRAITKPYPGAFSYIGKKKIHIWKAQPFDSKITYFQAKIGEVLEVMSTGDFIINCNSGLLLVTEASSSVKKDQVFTNKPKI
jgi:methionyl-tRNA formyltransferase